MSGALAVGVPQSEAELEEFAKILTESLNFPSRREIDYLPRYQVSDFRLTRRRGKVAGGLVLLRCGQFFAGERLDMAGVHAVAIAPEERGTGVGRELLAEVVAELARPGGPAIAALYPATQPIYRAVGFEQAGSFTRYRIPVASIPAGSHDLPVERVPPGEAGAALLAGLYGQVARRENGFIDRTPWFWQRVLEPIRLSVSAFCVREAGEVTGYLTLVRRWDTTHRILDSELVCREMFSATPAAARRLWTLLADERSLARALLVLGPPAPAEHLLMAEQTAALDTQIRWLLRVLDVQAALAGRGYPRGLSARAAIEVDDDLVPRNRGRFSIEVDGGRAAVRRGGGGDAVRVSIRGLAPLFSGLLTAEQVARAGLASGSPDALAALTAIFAAPDPWLSEMF